MTLLSQKSVSIRKKSADVQVPGHWESVGLKKSGWGTYVGTISVPDSLVGSLLMIHLPLFNGSTKVLVQCGNESVVVLQNGVPSSKGDQRHEYELQIRPLPRM